MKRWVALALSLPLAAWTGCACAALANGAVAAASPEAAEAGAEILRKGGNAVDAAIAVSLALGVTEPAGSGIGGQTSMVIYRPGAGPVVLNGTSFAPSATPPGAKLEQLLGGYTATTVPSTLRTLDYAWRHHGSGKIAWSDLVAPAIRHAEEGYRLGPFRYRSLARTGEELRANPATRTLFLDAEGRLPRPDAVFRQPALARTLRRVARFGAEDFYSGAIARDIAADMSAHGGWITAKDLERTPEPQKLKPLHGTYRGYDIHTLPPPAGGWAVLRALNILENFPQRQLASPGPDRSLHLIDALRAAHEARRASPFGELSGHQAELEQQIGKDAARVDFEALDRGGETTHFSVGDSGGMLVAVTQSLNSYFGARAASPKLGFLYNDYMREFELDQAGHPFALRPGAAPYSSMSATVVARKGVPVMAVGSPGSARIISAVAQTIEYWIDVEQKIEAATAASRVHVVPPDQVYVEQAELSPDLLRGIADRDMKLVRPAFGLAEGHLDPYFGGVHAVAIESGVLKGAADPRRDGAVVIVPAPSADR